jgi:hypothetical protein
LCCETSRLFDRQYAGHIDFNLRILQNLRLGVTPTPGESMELLLNLAWLLLALPAYWLWRGRKSTRGFSSLQCLLALGCLLVVLFPVISATDDLCAMKAEMEESPSGERSFRHASGDRAGLLNAVVHSHAALASSVRFYCSNDESWLLISSPCLQTPVAPAFEAASRAPPASFLG